MNRFYELVVNDTLKNAVDIRDENDQLEKERIQRNIKQMRNEFSGSNTLVRGYVVKNLIQLVTALGFAVWMLVLSDGRLFDYSSNFKIINFEECTMTDVSRSKNPFNFLDFINSMNFISDQIFLHSTQQPDIFLHLGHARCLRHLLRWPYGFHPIVGWGKTYEEATAISAQISRFEGQNENGRSRRKIEEGRDRQRRLFR